MAALDFGRRKGIGRMSYWGATLDFGRAPVVLIAVLVAGVLPWTSAGHRSQLVPAHLDLPVRIPGAEHPYVWPAGASHPQVPQFPVRNLPPRMAAILRPPPASLPEAPPLFPVLPPALDPPDVPAKPAADDLRAQAVIHKWQDLVATGYSKVQDDLTSLLQEMSSYIDQGVIETVFALVPTRALSSTSEKIAVDDVMDLGAVHHHMYWERDAGTLLETAIAQGIPNVSPGGLFPVIDVSPLIGHPGGAAPGAGAALLQQIARYAKRLNRLTVLSPLNAKLEAYYATLGFKKVEAYSHLMVYTENVDDGPDDPVWEMVSLNMS